MRKIVIIFFLLLLYVPFWYLIKCVNTFEIINTSDIDLIKNRQFQQKVISAINCIDIFNNFYTKIYTNIQYYVFGLPSRMQNEGSIDEYGKVTYNHVVGKDGYIFDGIFIYDVLSLDDRYNFSIEENKNKLNNYIKHMQSVQNKLKKVNKNFLVYFTPQKAQIFYDKIPNKYINMKPLNTESTCNILKQILSTTTINYFFSESLVKTLDFPTFYKKGIHWSRPFEQKNSVEIINMLSNISGKKYRNIQLGNINTSDRPYWRDNDIWDTFKVRDNSFKDKYYEYSFNRVYPDKYDKMRIFMQGDSFGEGLFHDVMYTYPNEDFYYIFYHGNVTKPNEMTHQKYTDLKWDCNNDWASYDFQYYLDNSDIVVVEICSSALCLFSNGFVEYLDQFLDNYVPLDHTDYYMRTLDASKVDKWNYEYLRGLYPQEKNFVWSKAVSEVRLKDENISKEGLSIEFYIPEFIFMNSDDFNIVIYINGNKYMDKNYNTEGAYKINFTAGELNKLNTDVYEIEFYCNKSVIPASIGISNDTRELSFQLKYVGRSR